MKKDLLQKAKKVECKDCKEGIRMCYHRPCWGTVQDFRKIIDAGFAKKLMIDYYHTPKIHNDEKIYFLCGANNGNECSKASWNPKGVCALLDENDKCTVHEIKPTMGAIACCRRDKKKIKYRILNDECIKTWDTDEGRALLEEWKKLVKYKKKEDDEGFSVMAAIGLMLDG